MAKKTLTNEIKKEVKSTAKKTVKKGAKKAVRTAKDGIEGAGVKSRAPQRSLALKIIPWGLCVFSIILAIFFVTVHILGGDAGLIGNPVQYALGGLFGGAALLVPLFMGYFGVVWAVYNIKWREEYMSKSNERYADYKKAKGRLVLKGIMGGLVILCVAAIFAVVAGYDAADGIDIADMWLSGGEELFLGGGGVFGGIIGGLLVSGIREVSSVIVLVALLVVFALLSVGLTPDYIFVKIQDAVARSREAREEKKAAEQERIAAERAREAEERERAAKAARAQKPTAPARPTAEAAPAVKTAAEVKRNDPPAAMSDDDIADLVNDEPQSTAPQNDPADDIVSRMFDNESDGARAEKVEEAPTSKVSGGDFGGEPGIDADGELDPLDDILKSLDLSTGEVVEPEPPAKTGVKEEAPRHISLSEIAEEDIRSDMAAVAPDEGDGEEEEEPPTPYIFPPVDMLVKGKNVSDSHAEEEIQENARQLVSTLRSFRIEVKDINCSRGPTITRYELRPEAGVRVRSIANLIDDISLSLATSGVRIEAPIPGKAAVGIEVPNKTRATVYLRDLIDNPQFVEAKSRLTASLGMDVGGKPIYFDITKMPHMLIAGATGMGKSVCINCIIISLLYKARPEDLKLILIDPKKVEFNIYKDIPHLYAPIVSEPKKAAGALASAVAEMERRFELIEEVGVRDITSYNAVTENDPYKEHMPHMVIIIDELADLMMTAPDEVETAICRLAQKARAAGIHIIIGTQRPSVDVITGLIKANIPSRIACTVASQVDSRTIIDIAGAEKLIGRGDMLFAPVGSAKPMRVQGAFVTDAEVESIVTYIRDNNAKASYNAEFINRLEEEASKCGMKKGGGDISPIGGSDDGTDSKFQAAVKLAVEEGKISTSLMQRRLGVGYGRAAKIIDCMEAKGYVSKPDGNKPRRVLLTAEEYARRVTEGTLGSDEE